LGAGHGCYHSWVRILASHLHQVRAWPRREVDAM